MSIDPLAHVWLPSHRGAIEITPTVPPMSMVRRHHRPPPQACGGRSVVHGTVLMGRSPTCYRSNRSTMSGLGRSTVHRDHSDIAPRSRWSALDERTFAVSKLAAILTIGLIPPGLSTLKTTSAWALLGKVSLPRSFAVGGS